MESQHQNPEFRINPENIYPCEYTSCYLKTTQFECLECQLYIMKDHMLRFPD